MGNQLIVSNSFWDICDILSNCKEKRMHLFCKVWILFLSFLERLGYHDEQVVWEEKENLVKYLQLSNYYDHVCRSKRLKARRIHY